MDFEEELPLLDPETVASVANSLFYCEKQRVKYARCLDKVLIIAVNVLHSSLWHPHLSERYSVMKAHSWVNSCVRRHVQLLKQLACLKEERREFTHLNSLIQKDKDLLEIKIKDTERSLYEKRDKMRNSNRYTGQESVGILESDIRLLLSTYERYNKNYVLYNNILDIIHKTLADTDITEKLAYLCGTVNRADAFQTNNFRSFEETMHKLLNDIANCDKTKQHINTQLTLARSEDLDMAINVGMEADAARGMSQYENFLQSGEILPKRSHYQKDQSVEVTNPSSSSLTPLST